MLAVKNEISSHMQSLCITTIHIILGAVHFVQVAMKILMFGLILDFMITEAAKGLQKVQHDFYTP